MLLPPLMLMLHDELLRPLCRRQLLPLLMLLDEMLHPGVAAQVACGRAKFVTRFLRWVKGQAQGLEPGGIKPWVN
jgi:hypothetical protein